MSRGILSQPERPSQVEALSPTWRHRSTLTAFASGLGNGVILLFLNISLAGLVYPSSLGAVQARGVGLMLVGAAVLAMVTALTSKLSISIAAPQAATVVIAGSIVSGIVASAAAAAPGTSLPITILAGVIVSSLVGGFVLFALGATGLGRIARFLPYPVVGGFIAGVGWLFISGAIGLSTGLTAGLGTLVPLFSPDALARWVPAAVVGTILVGGRRWWNPLLLFPATLIGAAALFHIVRLVGGAQPGADTADSWMLGPFAAGPLVQLLGPGEFGLIDWGLIAGQTLNIVAMPLVAAIVLILYLSGIEISTRRDVDVNRELVAAGLGTVAGGAFGGVTGFHLLSLSVLMHRAGVRSKFGGVVAAAVVTVPLFFDAALLNLLPRFVLAGLLIFFGYTFLFEWLVTQRRRMSRLDYSIVLVIIAVVAIYGLVPGVGVGLLAALWLFALEYSRVRVVRQVFTGAVRRSRVTRSAHEQNLLAASSDRIVALRLQGYIFFGTSASLLDTIHRQLAAHPATGTRFLILDFAAVTGLDSSGLYAFSRLAQQSAGLEWSVLLCGTNEQLRRQLDAIGSIEPNGPLRVVSDLDQALAWCEEALLREAGPQPTTMTLADQLAELFSEPDQLAELLGYLERREADVGERLLRAGAPADDLLFVESGIVTAQIERPGAAPIRLQTMGGGTVVGEIGLYLGSPRTADVVCEAPCVVYRLTHAALTRMGNEQPDLAIAVHKHLARHMAERLTHTIRALDAALDA